MRGLHTGGGCGRQRSSGRTVGDGGGGESRMKTINHTLKKAKGGGGRSRSRQGCIGGGHVPNVDDPTFVAHCHEITRLPRHPGDAPCALQFKHADACTRTAFVVDVFSVPDHHCPTTVQYKKINVRQGVPSNVKHTTQMLFGIGGRGRRF